MNNQYVGNRYVPKPCGEWDITKNTVYESLSVVLWEGSSLTSKKIVPKGIDITDTNFWVKSADYNAQVAIYEQNVRDYHQFVIDQIGIINQDNEEFKTSQQTNYNNFTEEQQANYNNFREEQQTNYDNFTENNSIELAKKSSKVFITPEEFGAIGDGVSDDTTSLQNAINYSSTNKITLKSYKNKKYAITSPLLITDYQLIDFGFATLKAIAAVPSIININLPIWVNGVHVLGTEIGILQNVNFDLNNLALKGLYVTMGRKYLLSNLNFINISNTGYQVDGGYELICKDWFFVGTAITSIGMNVQSQDSHYSNIVMTDCHKGIINRGLNFYNNIHGWMFTKEWLVDATTPTNSSIFMELHGDYGPILNQVYSDTYYISFYVCKYMRVMIEGLQTFFSESVYTSDYYLYKPYIFYFEKVDSTESTYTISDFSRGMIVNNSHIRGVASSCYAYLSNLTGNGNSFIRIPVSSNESVYVQDIEKNNLYSLSYYSGWVDNVNNCYNVLKRKDQRVLCQAKLYYSAGLSPNTQYTLASFPEKYNPSYERVISCILSTDGYSNGFVQAYCYISASGIIIKTPNDGVTYKYAILNFNYDLDYWL